MNEILKDTVPPHNADAEMATLGAMLIDWKCADSVVTFLKKEHFYSQQNQIIYKAMVSLFTRDIKEI